MRNMHWPEDAYQLTDRERTAPQPPRQSSGPGHRSAQARAPHIALISGHGAAGPRRAARILAEAGQIDAAFRSHPADWSAFEPEILDILRNRR